MNNPGCSEAEPGGRKCRLKTVRDSIEKKEIIVSDGRRMKKMEIGRYDSGVLFPEPAEGMTE
ncbi:MAG: hypothetical protein M1445_01635 [Bacteroidetes bacterium]|nr:hypothetical protein [Bacteroidota bacterium]